MMHPADGIEPAPAHPPRPVVPSGFLAVDKPAGMTSHTVVYQLRKQFGLPKSGKIGPGGVPVTRIGHLGTLDPYATGLLVMVLGNAGRAIEYLGQQDKTYQATIRLGVTSDTDDLTGLCVPLEPPPARWPERAAIEALLHDVFLGERQQLPPTISAVQVGGERAHRAARAGKPLTMQPRAVRLHACTVTRYEPPELDLTVTVSHGYYVRSLARDLGARLSMGGAVAALRRTAVGPWRIEQAQPLDRLDLTGVLPLYDLLMRRTPEELAATDPAPQTVRAVSRELGERIVCGLPVELGCERPLGLVWAVHRQTLIAALRPYGDCQWKPRKVFLDSADYRRQFPPG